MHKKLPTASTRKLGEMAAKKSCKYDEHRSFEDLLLFFFFFFFFFFSFLLILLLPPLSARFTSCKLISGWNLFSLCILRVTDQNGISQTCYIVKIHHSDPEPSIYFSPQKGILESFKRDPKTFAQSLWDSNVLELKGHQCEVK